MDTKDGDHETSTMSILYHGGARVTDTEITAQPPQCLVYLWHSMHGTAVEWSDLIEMLQDRYPSGRVQIVTLQAGRKKDCFGLGTKWYRYETSLVDAEEETQAEVALDSLEHAANRTFRDDGIGQRGWDELAVCVQTAVELIDEHLTAYARRWPTLVPPRHCCLTTRVILVGSSQGGTVAAATAAHLCQRGTPPGALLLLRSTILAPHLDMLLTPTWSTRQKTWMVQFVAQCDNQYGRAQQEEQARKLRGAGHMIDTVPSGLSHWDPIDFVDVLACFHTAFARTLAKPAFRCVGKQPPTLV
jgi:hypothetical protein